MARTDEEAAVARFPVLAKVLEGAEGEIRDAVFLRLRGPVPTAEQLSRRLIELGSPVSASTIRTYRRDLAEREEKP